MKNENFIFTSESVSEGHPDKICDQISDAVVDALLKKDSNARVACEALVKDDLVLLAGEIKANDEAKDSINYEKLIRDVIHKIGYTDPDTDPTLGFYDSTCKINNWLGRQSPNISKGVDKDDKEKQGAGDQGLMFGYATNETDRYMPAPIDYAHRLVKRHAELCAELRDEARKQEKAPDLRPDAKSQLTFEYKDGKPAAITAVVFSTQHNKALSLDGVKDMVKQQIINPVLEETGWLNKQTKYHINPAGEFVIGGPCGDCGLTGRKIIVDTYGGMARHGGGAFSGKDPSKVDRSAAYMARYIAKNVVAAELADKCEIQLSYAIGFDEPISVNVTTFGTGKLSDERLSELIREHFDLTPYGIIETLNLKRPIYQAAAAYGHFGREEFPWERCDKVNELLSAAG